jgi:NADH:ubiquinone oxidoreductase subunit 6 (subunit J)
MTFWASLVDYLGFFLSIIVLVGYLMALFTIIADLMRDHTLPGWSKALWAVALILVPFLSALTYLIVRGHGIARRQSAAVNEAQRATDDYIRAVVGTSPADEISKATQLLRDGSIDQAEFEDLKARVLAPGGR